MDALSDALRVMGLTGGVFLEASFTAPWCIGGKVGKEQCRPFLSTPSHVIAFHFVVEGRCVAKVESHAVCELLAGDVVLFPHNDLHMIGSDADLKPTPASELIQPPRGMELMKIEHGGGGDSTQLVCG